MSDNHASRDNVAVLEFRDERGIHLFFEASNTSGFLQPPDQYNKKFHLAYEKNKELHKRRITRSLTTADQLQILTEIWSYWSTPVDRIKSYLKVLSTNQPTNQPTQPHD